MKSLGGPLGGSVQLSLSVRLVDRLGRLRFGVDGRLLHTAGTACWPDRPNRFGGAVGTVAEHPNDKPGGTASLPANASVALNSAGAFVVVACTLREAASSQAIAVQPRGAVWGSGGRVLAGAKAARVRVGRALDFPGVERPVQKVARTTHVGTAGVWPRGRQLRAGPWSTAGSPVAADRVRLRPLLEELLALGPRLAGRLLDEAGVAGLAPDLELVDVMRLGPDVADQVVDV